MTPFSSNAHERSCGVSLGVVYGTVLTLIPISPDAYAYTLRIRRHPTYIPSSNTHAFTRHLRLHPMDTTSDMAEIQTHSKRQTIRPARRVNIPHPMHAYILVVSMYDLDNPRRSHTYTSNREQDQPPMKLQTERWTN
jgi:hypothetical protein